MPAAERKQIVREVLLDRENEVNKARKEVRSLREQISRLEMVLLHPSSAGDSTAVLPHSKGGSRKGDNKRRKDSGRGESGATQQGISHPENRGGKLDKRPLSRSVYDDNSDDDSMDNSDQRKVSQQRSYSPTARVYDGSDSNIPTQLSKSDAMKIVVSELRNLQLCCRDLENDKARLGRQVSVACDIHDLYNKNTPPCNSYSTKRLDTESSPWRFDYCSNA